MFKEDIKKISTLSIGKSNGVLVFKINKGYKTKEFSLENFLLTVKTKLESYLLDIFEHLGNRITRLQLYYDFIKLLDTKQYSLKSLLKNLVKKGNYVSAYVPFEKGQTSLVIYNFYSTNYGIRSKSHILIGLVDKNFKACGAFHFDISLREILSIQPEKYFKNISQLDPKFCVVLELNNRIEPDHGKSKHNKKGGHFRFFGVYNQFSAFNHSFFMPHPLKFARKIRSSLYPLSSFERMVNIKNKVVKNIVHVAPFYISKRGKIRGDVSGIFKALPGHTINKDKEGFINSVFHTTSSFSRKERQTSNFDWIEHVVALPPIKNLDVEMFFGECCTESI